MREKLQTLPLVQLRELAKAQGIKGVTTLKKAELIERLCEKTDDKTPDKAVDKAAVHMPERAGENESYRERPAEPAREKTPEQEERPARTYQQRNNYGRNENNSNYRGSQNYRGNNYRNSSGRSYPQNNSGIHAGSQEGGCQQGADRSDARNEGRAQESRYQDGRMQEARYQDSRIQENRYQQGRIQESGYQENRIHEYRENTVEDVKADLQELDSGIEAKGILEVMSDGFGFIRCENFLPGDNDVYVAPSQIRRFNLKTGDIVQGSRRIKTATEKFAALLYIETINGYPTSVVERRPNFESLTPIFPDERLHMEMPGTRNSTAMRVLDLLSPIGKGQRGMIVSPPKAGKTTLLKQVAKAVTVNHPDMHLMILLIDERPEEVTDIKEAITGPNVEVIYSTFDELPDRHKRVSEMVIERAKRLVEHGRDVMILLDSITRLARAYNLVVPASGRTLSGGLDPAALHMPKRFFGAARNIREGGSLTILATALIDTGSRMDDVIYEEFKGTGNMEIVLDRKLSEKRIFPAIDILKSGTRRDDLLLNPLESEAVDIIHKATNTAKPEESVERILDLFARTKNNREFVDMVKKVRI